METNLKTTSIQIDKDKWAALRILSIKKTISAGVLLNEGIDYILEKYSKD